MARAPLAGDALQQALAAHFCRALRDQQPAQAQPATEPLDTVAERLRRETIEAALQNLRSARASGDPRALTTAVQASTAALRTCGFDGEKKASAGAGVEIVVKEADVGDERSDASGAREAQEAAR